MDTQKFTAVYYPDALIADRGSLATFSLFFDELHLVSPSDDAKDPTSNLMKISEKTSIIPLGNPSKDEIERVVRYYQFAFDNKPLLKKVIFYHPHLMAEQINNMTNKLMNGGVSVDELYDFLSGNTAEQKAFNEFSNKHAEIVDEMVLRIAPTALWLAQSNDWILISDIEKMPVPLYSRQESRTVRNFASILAEECIKLALPRCLNCTAEEILEVREDLKELLVPFRMAMQKLTKDLKNAIKDESDINQIKREARFIAQSCVEPALFDLQKKIESEKNKLFLKVFGHFIGWIPFIAKLFIAPSPDQIYQSMIKMYGDVGSLTKDINEYSISKEPGLSFLLGVGAKFGNLDK